MNINKKARELMAKYPNMIKVGELTAEVPDDINRRKVLSRMMYFAQADRENEVLGPNLLK